MFGIASAAQYPNAKCGNIFLFFIFVVIEKENAETVFMFFFSFMHIYLDTLRMIPDKRIHFSD